MKAKEILLGISMENINASQETPWTWWSGGPVEKGFGFAIKDTEDTTPHYEHWICSPILKQTHDTKNRIDSIYQQGVWDDFKKITNPYEYVFLSLNRRMSRSVATRTPLSRSYFKMLEMLKGANILSELTSLAERDEGLITTHAAEGPGGFIEAIHDQAPNVKLSQGITLRSTSVNIPGWRKTTNFLAKHPQVKIHYGADDTGDLLKLQNIDAFVDSLQTKAHLYTADGGFDFSSDFNAQEEAILTLLVAEFYLGLKSIQKGGIICVKIFDTILRPTLELVWIVTRHFREWTITKPRTSRGGNAERYIICKGFLGMDESTDQFFRDVMTTAAEGKTIVSLLGKRPDSTWMQTMLSIQESISKQETAIITMTLSLIEKPDKPLIRTYIEQNVSRSIQWCVEHGEETNKKWSDEAWRERTIQDEIAELLNEKPAHQTNSNVFTSGWRGLAEASQTDSQEQNQQQQKRRVVTFSRPRPSQAVTASVRARRAGSPDSEGWQKVSGTRTGNR